jgi:pyruvate dehydrogenase E2 component (dihydrolipoamide acetyltransferase)
MAEIVTMPKLGFDMAEGLLVRWVKSEGDAVNKGDVLAEIETDKATVEVSSSFSGVLARHLVEAGTQVPVNAAIAVIAAPGENLDNLPLGAPTLPEKAPAAAAPAAAVAEPPVSQASAVAEGQVKASPLARKIALDHSLDLHGVPGSGPGGRVVKRDVESLLAQPPVAAVLPAAAPHEPVKPAAQPVPLMPAVFGAAPQDQTVPLDKLRSAIARRMLESKTRLPHFYVTHEFNVEPLLALRKQLNVLLPEEQKLSVNDFIVKAVALALRQFPGLNASFNEKEIVRHGHVNIGVAVSLGSGLLTVVTRDADLKPLRQISLEIKDMVARARAGKVRPDDIEGSTFSISNLGMYDVENFAAIINPPEAAILAVGSARQVPVVVDGALAVGTRLKATLSADHRASDGVEAAQFLQALAVLIEQPMRLLV